MTAYYNEIDPAAAHILNALIAEGVIAHGIVDTRSIKEVQPDDLIGFTQCHFFAGGGLWSVAARLAGWPDDEPLWTGSCPCQPFSAAGKGAGTDDPRHLWPDFHRLIRARRPTVCMGEQVAGKAGYGWFDGVRADLAHEGFASRTVDFPACSVDAPHQRNRLYWVAMEHAEADGAERGNLANVHRQDEFCGRPGNALEATGASSTRPELVGDGAKSSDAFARRNGTYWSDAEWIACHDDKARRTKPGLRFLVDGLPGRVDLWRVGGNAIVPEAAAEVISAFIDVYGLPSMWGVAA